MFFSKDKLSLVTLLALLLSSTWMSVPAAPAPPDSLEELNKSFRDIYARGRQATLKHTHPIVIVEGDNLVLLRNGQRTEVRIVPEIYHTLKAVSHIPLAVYALFAPYGADEIGAPRLTEIQEYRKLLRSAGKGLEGRVSKELMERQLAIIAAAQQFLDRAVEMRKVDTNALTVFTRTMGPLVLANGAAAAQAQLDALQKQMTSWRAALTPAEWQRLRIVIMGSALPRKGNVNVQYFARLLGEPGEGPRIIYTESIFEEERALRSLGTYLIDTEIGAAFFNDQQRMLRDLLDDAAAQYIKKMRFEP